MTFDPNAIALSIGAGTAAGLVGCFAVMRRMTLAADAISHIALPGIGLALLLRIHPILGGVAALLVGTLLVWGIEGRTRLATETIIGLVFSTALAVGSLITSGDELIEALFGGVGPLTTIEATLGLILSLGVVVFVVSHRHRLVLALVSPEIAHATGINVRRLNLFFLLVFALTIALGLRYLASFSSARSSSFQLPRPNVSPIACEPCSSLPWPSRLHRRHLVRGYLSSCTGRRDP